MNKIINYESYRRKFRQNNLNLKGELDEKS